MKIAVDLHIHSGLSPCSEDDMTPNNIVGMAKLKGLDAIAITDHNSVKNLKAFTKVAEENGLILIPGVEVTTKEEVHLVGLFEDLEGALLFQEVLDQHLPKIPNNKKVFGSQCLYNEMDEIIGEYEHLLINAISLNIEDTVREIRSAKGIVFPAHINRRGFSILTNLGFIPPEFGFNTVEITESCDYSALEHKHSYLNKFIKIRNSDAHNLGNLLEREFFLEVDELSVKGVIKALSKM
ncbi:PHP domain-containing protein [Alkaliphilus hydrothermalis]|uniref:Metal-dependent phosphoesterase TrpH n=1 Tax=Alkaliphilus hydrothermalis TaxID=1482730 RepID=A0ABS2NL20_9FIRM|nr:PHP domain-containing protein [Alkaliphilus hydrothermalis]MBM7613566.1 putative metal-dependent phosphoesterase TrpH [Alkaliphilus hydrothermalis]